MSNDLESHMSWLYPDPTQPCICNHEYKGLGRLHGVDMGKGWVRTSTDPECIWHGKNGKDVH